MATTVRSVIFVLAFTGVPLALWLLAARSGRGRLVGSAVLIGLGLGEWVTGNGWLVPASSAPYR